MKNKELFNAGKKTAKVGCAITMVFFGLIFIAIVIIILSAFN